MSELLPPDSDLRRSERLDTHLNALVLNSWQEQCTALVTNITREGLRLEGRRELVDIIFPNFNATRPALRHSINLRLALEEGAKLTDLNGIDIRCNSIYVVRERQDWFQLGLSYCEIDSTTAVRLEAFITELELAQVVVESGGCQYTP